jgi:hypothetical protein
VVVALAAWRLHAAFRASPANFPVGVEAPTPERSLPTVYTKSKKGLD